MRICPVSSLCLARIIIRPKPFCDARNSEARDNAQAWPTITFNPPINSGIIAGKITVRKSWLFLAPRERANF